MRDVDQASSFRSLFEACYQPLLAYALRRTGSPGDAQDVVADVFLVAWRRRGELPVDARERRLWLFGAARRVLANRHRSELRYLRLVDRVIGAGKVTETSPDQPDLEDLELAWVALESLAPSDQELILLSVWEELPNVEIAGVLGTSRANVAVRLHRAKTRLREEFNNALQSTSTFGHVDDVSHHAYIEPEHRR